MPPAVEGAVRCLSVPSHRILAAPDHALAGVSETPGAVRSVVDIPGGGLQVRSDRGVR